tara:strand:+ start:702 stop:1550 length:849 start_codon:yes stop_codon:yes gene_type:complete
MTDIILNRFLTNTDTANNQIKNFIENKDEFITNPYKVLSTIPSNNILLYFFIIIIVYAFFKNKNIQLNEIFVFLICFVIIYILSQKDYDDFLKFTRKKDDEIKFLNKILFNGIKTTKGDTLNFESSNNNIKKSYLYYDALITSLMYNLRTYSQYNIQAYSACLFHINELLKISHQSSNIQYSLLENYEAMIIEKKKALNSLSSMIYSIHTTSLTYQKYNNAIEKLHELLNSHILKISKLFKDKISNDSNKAGYIPADFFELNTIIAPNDLETKNYNATYNLY